MATRKRKRSPSPSYVRLDAFARGEILGMRQAGATREEIQRKVRKKDGRSASATGIDDVIAAPSPG